MQIIFTATTGRSGTHNLFSLFQRFARNCAAEHEAPDLLLRRLIQTRFLRQRGWFSECGRVANFGRHLQRKFIVTNEQMGRGRALEWFHRGDSEKLLELTAKKLKRIRRFERRGCCHYVESSQFFLRTFYRTMPRLLPDFGLIKLTRNPLQVAKSTANRGKPLSRVTVPPDSPGNLFRLPHWQDLSPFQHYLHLWLETELRYHDAVQRFGITKTFEIPTPELLDGAKVESMFRYFGIEHDEISGLEPTNTNLFARNSATMIESRDIAEFHQVLDLMPADLRHKITYLQGFDPAAS